LSEHRRLNVAVTRAKRHVAVICNVDCVSSDGVLKTFTDYLQANADVRTATQYDHLIGDVVRWHYVFLSNSKLLTDIMSTDIMSTDIMSTDIMSTDIMSTDIMSTDR
jgi:hypothetical protein